MWKTCVRAAAEVDVHAIHLGEVPLRQPEAGDGDEEVEDAGRAVACAVDEHESAGAGAGERALGDPETSAAPTAASTAFPPAASTSAPACAVNG